MYLRHHSGIICKENKGRARQREALEACCEGHQHLATTYTQLEVMQDMGMKPGVKAVHNGAASTCPKQQGRAASAAVRAHLLLTNNHLLSWPRRIDH